MTLLEVPHKCYKKDFSLRTFGASTRASLDADYDITEFIIVDIELSVDIKYTTKNNTKLVCR